MQVIQAKPDCSTAMIKAAVLLVVSVLGSGQVLAQTIDAQPVLAQSAPAQTASNEDRELSALTDALGNEVRDKGWVAFSARSPAGDWDLFLMRPDGSQLRPLTSTPQWNDFWPQFSRDGKQLLYRRLPRSETISGNRYGEQGQPMLANSDGSQPRALGGDGELPWASWSPDGRQLATLSIKGIAFVEVETGKTIRSLPRKGFFQQLIWSPDGQWLCGVANSFGTGWSVARLNASTGEANPVSRIDCCTPDWFPNGDQIIFSNRPEGQKGNANKGWTQLWSSDSRGEARHFIYGEDGRHIYGGAVSPDGRYALFTGNPQEDGDPEHNGAPMGLLRLSDAPLVTGQSVELRALYPHAKSGPVLRLPIGWEPCWTFSESPAADEANTKALTAELRQRGWIVCSSVTEEGDWDLTLLRPDGSDRRNLTQTREFNETGARFSPDGKRLLYYRQPTSVPIDNNTYGTYELILANSDGTNPVSYGTDYPWAAWGPDSKSFAALTTGGIQWVDTESRQVIRTLPRKGIVQQLVCSPDGKQFAGTANGLGQYWNIGVMQADSKKIVSASETERYNCTPDWLPDSQHVIYARGIIPGKEEAPSESARAELWIATGDGRDRRMLYADATRHIYGAASSPDAQYYLFTRSVEDLGRVNHTGTTMAIIRASDTPMIEGDDPALRARFPKAGPARRIDIGPGWEPHWTDHDVLRAATSGVSK